MTKDKDTIRKYEKELRIIRFKLCSKLIGRPLSYSYNKQRIGGKKHLIDRCKGNFNTKIELKEALSKANLPGGVKQSVRVSNFLF